MKKADISVIIPAYNEERYVDKTLEYIERAKKVYKKTGNKAEVIVINNNSSDETENIANEYGAKIVFVKENHIARAKNRGASYAEGKYLIFVDADTFGTHPS